jgi:NADPH:quinone reductase-like Zn-dependent oxidoreductase
MKAITRREYGSPEVLGLEEVARPEVGDDEVLVEVRAASVNASDVENLVGKPAYVRLVGFGFWKPKVRILGSDVAGRVSAVGGKVTRFRPGDEVLADTLYHGLGGFAEYVAVPEGAPMVRKPEGLSFEAAAAIPQAAVIALQGIRDRGRVQAGQRVLINGAGGGAGSFAVQLASSAGAEVTAVDRGSKLEMLRRLGAQQTVDYTREDFTASGRRYDFILDLAAHRSIFDHRRALKPNGVYGMVGGSMGSLLRALVLGPLISRTGSRKMGLLAIGPNNEDLARVAGLVAQGELEAVIDRRYPLGETAAALCRVAAGEARGKVVITM